MEWLLLIGLYLVGAPLALGAWALAQSQRIEALSRQVEALARTIAEAERTALPAAAAVRAEEVVSESRRLDDAPEGATEAERSVPASPSAGSEAGTISDASVFDPAPAPPVAAALAPDATPSKPYFHRDAEERERPRAAERRPPLADFSLELWLSERGVAWLGGGTLALGGVFLVAFAVQRGFFTPQMRLIAAAVLGALLIGASEWVRRTEREGPTNHPLVAALLAGAGAGILYAACWGAYGLYNYIPWSGAAVALAACSALLLGLALLHGEALGVLAIIAALLAPLLAGKTAWPANALTLYLVIAASAGFAIAAFRRWAWATAAAMLASYAWFAVSLADGATVRSLVLVCLAAAGGSAVALRPPPKRAESDKTTDVHALASVAVALSSVLLLAHWANDPQPAGATLASLAILALATMAVRAGRMAPAALVVSLIAVPACYFVYSLPLRVGEGRTDLQVWYAWALLSAGGAGVAGLAAALRVKDEPRGLVAGAGAFSALAVTVVAALAQGDFSALTVWAPLAVAALLLFAGAYVLSTRVEDAPADAAVDCWAGAAAGALLLTIESAVSVQWKPLADAVAALLLAALHARLGWRMAQTASAIAAAASLAHAFSSDFAGRTLAGELDLWLALVALAAAAASMFAGAYLLRRRARVDGFVESLSSAAILIIVLSGFLLLRWWASGGAGGRLDSFTEMSLQALALIAAGFVAIPRRGQSAGVIARVRGHVLMGAGLVFNAISQGLLLHPWWGVFPAHVSGPPIVNANALAFAAPAVLALLVAGRFYGRVRVIARVYLGAGAVLGFSWVATEIRRAFHGAAMAQGPIGLAEGSAYGLAALVVALVVALLARVRAGPEREEAPFTEDLVRASKGMAMAGVLVAALFLCVVRNAWWGGQAGHLTQAAETALATAAHSLAAIICILLARTQLAEADKTRRFACGAAALFALTFGILAIRWIHHGGAMDNGAPLSGLEAFGYALWPMALAAVGAKLCELVAEQPAWSLTARSMGAALSTAIWPGLAFLALGLCLFYCPWWGLWPVDPKTWFDAVLTLSVYLAAAALSLWSARLVILWENGAYAACAKVSAVGHLFVAATLVVRRIYSGPAMDARAPGDIETWAYSAVWALFGAIVVGMGALKRDSILRWSGLAILFAAAAKVFLIDMRDLEGVVRAGSFLALGAVLIMVALAARRFSRSQESRSA